MNAQAQKLSVVISTKNNIATLPRILNACAFADEVVVVDDFSDDGCYRVAQEHPRVTLAYQRKFDRPAIHRMHLISQSRGAWVLVLDGDEIPSATLGAELKACVVEDKVYAFRLPMRCVPPTHWNSAAYYQEHQIRFFKRGHVRWEDEPGRVHTPAIVDGPCKKLKASVRHESFDSMQHLLNKQLHYGFRSGEYAAKQGKNVSSWAPATRFFATFMKYYIFKGLFRFGGVGFNLAYSVALQNFSKYFALWAARFPSNAQARNENMANVLENTPS